MNHWFYLLCTGNGQGLSPIPFDHAEQIAYDMQSFLTSTSDYADARQASINAARVYGICSFEERMVTNAWALVGDADVNHVRFHFLPSPCEPSCQYSFASTPNQNVACGSTTTLTSTCTGDCEGIQYQWVNQQLQNIGTTPSIQATVPNQSGTYFYHVVGYKTRINLPGCTEIATTTLTTPSTCTPPPKLQLCRICQS